MRWLFADGGDADRAYAEHVLDVLGRQNAQAIAVDSADEFREAAGALTGGITRRQTTSNDRTPVGAAPAAMERAPFHDEAGAKRSPVGAALAATERRQHVTSKLGSTGLIAAPQLLHTTSNDRSPVGAALAARERRQHVTSKLGSTGLIAAPQLLRTTSNDRSPVGAVHHFMTKPGPNEAL